LTRGVVAAGAPGTAEAAAEILRQGGNAVDAACAACFATSAYEPVLTSLAGGGVMLVRDAARGETSLIDFFSNAPGLGAPAGAERDFQPVTVDFGSAQQIFHIGRAAAAVPGTLLGLGVALERHGSLPLAAVVAPAVTALRQGVSLDRFQAWTFNLLGPIVTHSSSTRACYAPGGTPLGEGERFRNPALADTLQVMAADSIAGYYTKVLAPMLLEEFGPAAGGGLTAQDLERYQVERRQPLVRRYRGASLSTHPWPAQGGTMVSSMLALLEAVDLHALDRGGVEHLRALSAAMRSADEIKLSRRDPFAGGDLACWHERFEALRAGATGPTAPPPRGMGSTTHISVIDAEGNAAAVTISYGEGCGYTLGDTGIVLNNFMGEDDLHPDGFFVVQPGLRLATNMCPVALEHEGRLVVLGSGGANRIRTAIAQVICNLVDFGLSPENAVTAGRLHVEGGSVNAEIFDLPGGAAALGAVARTGEEIAAFDTHNLFFGGVHLALRDSDGSFAGAGDPRRTGHVVLVD